MYGWEQKKTKASWGETIDYGSIAENAVREMDDSRVQHFFMVCALVSDLYCPGYGPRQPLGKDSNLARAAARYKVDLTKVSAAVRAAQALADPAGRWTRGVSFGGIAGNRASAWTPSESNRNANIPYNVSRSGAR